MGYLPISSQEAIGRRNHVISKSIGREDANTETIICSLEGLAERFGISMSVNE